MIQILGGIGLIFFGVRFLRKGLDRLFGGRLMTWLATVTKGRVKAMLTGVAIGTVAPSSTGASLMTVQMLNTGRIDASSMLAVLLGTNIGITVAAQLLAFRVQDYVGLMIFFGVVGFQYMRGNLVRGIGQCILALGFVFLAIDIIGIGASNLAGDPDVREVLKVFSLFPWLLLIATAIFAMVLQSSTASIGLGIAMASGGLLEGGLLGWWVLGTNLGIGMTSLVAAWGTQDGRRLGVANLVLKCLVAAPLLLVPGLLSWVFHIVPGTLERQTTMLHTDYNLLVALVALPVLPAIWRAVSTIMPVAAEETFAPTASYLDAKALETPSLALSRASRECMRMAEHVRFMLEQFLLAYLKRDPTLARRVQREDDVVDKINIDLKEYLSRIGDGLGPAEVQWQFALHGISSELEAIADVIDQHLCAVVIKQGHEGIYVPECDELAVEEGFRRVEYRLELGIGLITTRDIPAAEEFVRAKQPLDEWVRASQRKHFVNISNGDQKALAASPIFLDLLNGVKRINSHLGILGYAIVNSTPDKASLFRADALEEALRDHDAESVS